MGTPYKLCRTGFHVRRDSNPNILNIINPLELIVLCCMLYIQFRASGYIWGWLFDISDSSYKFRLNSSGCVLHSPAELKFIRGAMQKQPETEVTIDPVIPLNRWSAAHRLLCTSCGPTAFPSLIPNRTVLFRTNSVFFCYECACTALLLV